MQQGWHEPRDVPGAVRQARRRLGTDAEWRVGCRRRPRADYRNLRLRSASTAKEVTELAKGPVVPALDLIHEGLRPSGDRGPELGRIDECVLHCFPKLPTDGLEHCAEEPDGAGEGSLYGVRQGLREERTRRWDHAVLQPDWEVQEAQRDHPPSGGLYVREPAQDFVGKRLREEA